MTTGLDDVVDRCHLEIQRVLTYLDVVEPEDRACVVAALLVRLEEVLDRQARQAIALGERGTQAAIARALGVSPQAVSKRFRQDDA